MKLFLDLDEVLANFVDAACWLRGVHPSNVHALRRNGVWEISAPLGQMLLQRDMTLAEFWEPMREVNGGERRWWANLRPLPWFEEFYHFMRLLDPELNLVSSPNHRADSRWGKYDWIQKHMPEHDLHRVYLTRHKELLAAPGRLLIDDQPANCERWESAGGTAYLFPSGNPEEVAEKVPGIIKEIASLFTPPSVS